MTSMGARRRQAKANRMKARPTAETSSAIVASRKRTEVSAKEDRPYAEKRKTMAQCPIDWLARHSHITLIERQAARDFARDWYTAGRSTIVTATMEPRTPGRADWDTTEAIEAHSRFRWITVRIEPQAHWSVLEAVVLHEKPIVEWIAGMKAAYERAKDIDEAKRAELRRLIGPRMSSEDHSRALDLETELKTSHASLAVLIASIVDKSVAMRNLHAALAQLVRLRREYWHEYGADGQQAGKALTVEAERERAELFGA